MKDRILQSKTSNKKIDESNVLVIVIESVQDIKAEELIDASRYYVAVGFPIESESSVVALPIGRYNSSCIRSMAIPIFWSFLDPIQMM